MTEWDSDINRAAACVDACAGIPTEVLERNPPRLVLKALDAKLTVKYEKMGKLGGFTHQSWADCLSGKCQLYIIYPSAFEDESEEYMKFIYKRYDISPQERDTDAEG